jgi:DNA-3-methyladenine glycosylase
LGKTLVREEACRRSTVRIVETEAYLPEIDSASHAYRGMTARNRSMFLRRGHAYVYLIYGAYFCLNETSESADVGAAVLIRAAEPLEGIPLMSRRRGTERRNDLLRGPGRLAQALGIDRRQDGIDLCSAGSPLRLAAGSAPESIGESVRIGLSREVDRVLRFYERGSPFVSGPRSLNRGPR